MKLFDSELKVMDVLWTNGDMPARQIAAIGEEESKRETDAHIDAAQKKARGQAKKIVAAAEENMHTAVNEIIRGIFEKWQ